MKLGIVPTYVWRWRFNVIVAMIIISSLRWSSLTCKHGKIFPFSSHKNEIGVLLLLHLVSDRNPHIFNCRKICKGGKNLVFSCPGVAFATPCHPMATGLSYFNDNRKSTDFQKPFYCNRVPPYQDNYWDPGQSITYLLLKIEFLTPKLTILSGEGQNHVSFFIWRASPPVPP